MKETLVNFADVAHGRLGITTQSASYYVHGLADRPCLGEGLIILGPEGSYHSWQMTEATACEFVKRVKQYRAEEGRKYGF